MPEASHKMRDPYGLIPGLVAPLEQPALRWCPLEWALV